MEYLSLCRTCLTENLGEEFGTIFDICENEIKFSEILQLIAPQVDLNDDNLTKIICYDCMNQFREINKFREQILCSNDVLRKEPIFEEIIEYPMKDDKIQEDYSLVEIEPSESNLLLDFPCDEMIVEVEENEEVHLEINCTKCSMSFDSEKSLEDHMKSHSPKSRFPICKVCNKRFQTLSKLKQHEIIHSDLVIEIKNGSENFCLICKVDLDSKSEFEEHLLDHKSKMENKYLECDQCEKPFEKFSVFYRHLKTHHEGKTHQCVICKETFAMGQELIDHLHEHKGTILHACNICGKSYSHEARLKVHLESHTERKAYLCTECGKSFNRNSNLRQHLLRHSGIRRFNCSQCPAKFVSKGNLKAHMTTHSNKKPFECTICGSSFTQSYSLLKHNRIHTGDRPYQCEVCEMKFYSSDHLKRHMRTHTGERPFKCNFCSKSFAQNGDLNKHKRLHVGEKTYICDWPGCKDAFRLLSELREHHKIHYASDVKIRNKFESLEEIDEVSS